MSNGSIHNSEEQRQQLLSTLALSSVDDITHHWSALKITADYDVLKQPEVGMVMVRAKTSGIGKPFNMGEMTVTRSVVCLRQVNHYDCEPSVGFGYTAGRHLKKAESIAVIDACSQLTAYQSCIFEQLFKPLQSILESKKKIHAEKVESTKVNFFTMVRGE